MVDYIHTLQQPVDTVITNTKPRAMLAKHAGWASSYGLHCRACSTYQNASLRRRLVAKRLSCRGRHIQSSRMVMNAKAQHYLRSARQFASHQHFHCKSKRVRAASVLIAWQVLSHGTRRVSIHVGGTMPHHRRKVSCPPQQTELT